MYVSNVSYTLSTDGTFSESTTYVGNDKQWLTASEAGLLSDENGVLDAAFATTVFGNDAPVGVNNSVLRRQNLVIGSGGFVAWSGATGYIIATSQTCFP